MDNYSLSRRRRRRTVAKTERTEVIETRPPAVDHRRLTQLVSRSNIFGFSGSSVVKSCDRKAKLFLCAIDDNAALGAN